MPLARTFPFNLWERDHFDARVEADVRQEIRNTGEPIGVPLCGYRATVRAKVELALLEYAMPAGNC